MLWRSFCTKKRRIWTSNKKVMTSLRLQPLAVVGRAAGGGVAIFPSQEHAWQSTLLITRSMTAPRQRK